MTTVEAYLKSQGHEPARYGGRKCVLPGGLDLASVSATDGVREKAFPKFYPQGTGQPPYRLLGIQVSNVVSAVQDGLQPAKFGRSAHSTLLWETVQGNPQKILVVVVAQRHVSDDQRPWSISNCSECP